MFTLYDFFFEVSVPLFACLNSDAILGEKKKPLQFLQPR